MEYIAWNGSAVSKYVLGTAQLGMHYGVANVHGQPDEREVGNIVEVACLHGVNCFDTAQAYGASEAALGKALRRCGMTSNALVVSKLSPALNPCEAGAVEKSVFDSCEKLGVEALWCLMLHRPVWLQQWHSGLGETLASLQEMGIVKHVGVSLDSPQEAEQALQYPALRVFQVPCNAWNQAMLATGFFSSARQKDIFCFVRSVYLQGLLLLSPERVCTVLPMAEKAAREWRKIASELGQSPQQLAVRFGLSLAYPLVIGVEESKQLEANVALLREPQLPRHVIENISSRLSPFLNETIVNAAHWS